jgi:hypothetical protein
MRRAGVFALLVLLFQNPWQPTARPAERTQHDKKVDQAISKALTFLKNHQHKDGTWGGGPRGTAGDPAITALCVMAFLSAGHIPGEGPYGDTLEKGARAVLRFQNPSSGLIASRLRNYEMYQHGICTLMLAEVAGMTDDKKLAEAVRKAIVKAVKLILVAQRKANNPRYPNPHRGGWRYRVVGNDSDMSVTGWQLLALRAAKNLGCDVPDDRIKQAVDYIKRSQDAGSGGFRYQVGGGVTIPCTGTGILALEICGKDWHQTRAAKRAGTYLLSQVRNWNRAFYSYGIYYCSQAMFQLGGNYWKSFRPTLHTWLLGSQQANGSWLADSFGPNYSTAMAVLALTVEYRYLPIYQRDEGQEKAN